jgi:hypothetical protein
MFTIGRTITTTAIATTAAAVTFVFPGPGAAIPVDDVPAPRTDTVMVERPCYMARPGWNTAGDEQPVCYTEVRARIRRPAER